MKKRFGRHVLAFLAKSLQIHQLASNWPPTWQRIRLAMIHVWTVELIMRRYEQANTLLTSNRPVEDWGKLLGDSAAVTAMLDRLLHHGHVLKCGPRSWRTKINLPAEDSAE